MKTPDDYTNRLPEHEQPLELTGHTEPKAIEAHKEDKQIAAAPAAAAAAAPPAAEPPAAAAAATPHHSGGIGWAVLAAIAAAVLVGSIFLYSGLSHRMPDRAPATADMNSATKAVTPQLNPIYVIQSSDVLPERLNEAVVAGQLVPVTAYTIKRPTAASAVDVSTGATTGEGIDDAVCFFALDGSAVGNNDDLDQLAERAHDTDGYVTVAGYTDESGRVSYNEALSRRRAEQVKQYLIKHGVPASHIVVVGMGPTHKYPTARQNRRADVHLEI